MKFLSFLIMLAIVLSALLPPAMPLLAGHDSEELGTLDVCRSAVPALSAQGQMPCIHVCSRCPMPLTSSTSAIPEAPVFQPLLLAFRDERPPKS